MTLLIDALATFRLTRLITTDRITRGPRNALEQRGGELGYWVGCDWCASAAVGIGVVLARRFTPRLWGPLAEALAFSAITGLIADHG